MKEEPDTLGSQKAMRPCHAGENRSRQPVICAGGGVWLAHARDELLELAETARTLAGEGKAVVMVLHDLNLALSCAHRVAVLEEGQLRRVGAPEEIYASGVLEKVFQVRVHSVETAKGERQYLFSRL